MREKIDARDGEDARGLSNLILDSFDSEHYEISNLKINKILYFMHGFYHARFGKKLIRNHIEAWDNGPVVRVVFDAFKQNGRRPISNRAIVYDYVLDRENVARALERPPEERDYLLKIAQYYVKFTAGQLVELTHQPGTPWFRARQLNDDQARFRNRIPDDWISNFFVENFGAKSGN